MPRWIRRTALAPFLLAFLLALALPACDSGGDEPPTRQDSVIAGLNFTRLFAPATPAEVADVRADWAARTPTAAAIEVRGPAPAPDGSQIYVVSHALTGPGAAGRHYGFVRVPAGASNFPVLVVHHGGDQGVFAGAPNANVGVLAVAQAFPGIASKTVQVFPSYRSEPLGTQGFEPVLGPPVVSGGTASPWDYDVDDAMALLSAVLARDEFAAATDAGRVGALGFSRGGNTALLHQIRDRRVRAVTEYYGPSDFYNVGAQQLALALLGGAGPTTMQAAMGLPGAPYLYTSVLNPLRNADGSVNEGADYARARLEVARRSPSLFTSSLRNVQVHHHRRDGVVPVAFSEAFDVAAQTARPQGAYEFNLYGEAGAGDPSVHNPAAMPESLGRTDAFLTQTLVNAGRMAVW